MEEEFSDDDVERDPDADQAQNQTQAPSLAAARRAIHSRTPIQKHFKSTDKIWNAIVKEFWKGVVLEPPHVLGIEECSAIPNRRPRSRQPTIRPKPWRSSCRSPRARQRPPLHKLSTSTQTRLSSPPGDVDQNVKASGLGGIAPVLRHMDSLRLKLIRLDRYNANTEKPPVRYRMPLQNRAPHICPGCGRQGCRARRRFHRAARGARSKGGTSIGRTTCASGAR